jgi:hypothetical protein
VNDRAWERHARKVTCPFCNAKPGKPCVYTDGPFMGQRKGSGAHGQRYLAAVAAEETV